MAGCYGKLQKTIKLSDVFKVKSIFAKRQEIFYVYKILEVTRKFGNCLGTHEVEYCQKTGGIWKQRGYIGGTARYGKWQDGMANGIKL